MNRDESLIEEVPARQDFHAERLELQTVLATALNRSSNMKRLLLYICDRYFCGQAADIKEYSIAVDAFGRSPEFDPAVDSIVRVEAFRLRVKLARYYQQKGARQRVQIVLPAGGYVPQFIHLPADEVLASDNEGPLHTLQTIRLEAVPVVQPAVLAVLDRPEKAKTTVQWPTARFWFVLIGVAAFLTLAALSVWRFAKPGMNASNALQVGAVANSALEPNTLQVPTPNDSSAVRIIAGSKSSQVTDERGEIWWGDRYFQGGDPEAISPRTFDFTSTPSLYFRRRRGSFSYAIPLRKGIYELKLHFADAFFGQGNPEEGGEGSRLFDVNANGKALLSDFDVIADAGGSNTADVKVFRDIRPAADGFLHLDFISRRNVAFINAIEVLPEPSQKIIPIRIYAGTTDYKDSAGIFWNSDRYFRGGVHHHQLANQSAIADSSGFTDERFGNFIYQLPIAEDGVYIARLRFCPENIITPQPTDNGGNIFNVHLNGATLLENFQIPAATQSTGCVVRQFTGLKPNAQGKLIFSFVPVRGYASVSSIAIDEE
jgi:hypothetical protein